MKVDSITDKGVGKINEDQILIGQNIFGVFDGASSLNGYSRGDGKTGGYLASKIAKDTFLGNDKPLLDLFKKSNQEIDNEMRKHSIEASDVVNRWSTTVAVARFKGDEIEWLKIGDCAILIVKTDCSVELAGGYQEHDLDAMRVWKKLADNHDQNIREQVRPLAIENRKMTNLTYGSMNGQVSAENFVLQGVLQRQDLKHILIFTDGALLPKENPDSDEDWRGIVDIFLSTGVRGVKEMVRSIETADPNCWKFPRFKRHDDLSIVGITL